MCEFRFRSIAELDRTQPWIEFDLVRLSSIDLMPDFLQTDVNTMTSSRPQPYHVTKKGVCITEELGREYQRFGNVLEIGCSESSPFFTDWRGNIFKIEK